MAIQILQIYFNKFIQYNNFFSRSRSMFVTITLAIKPIFLRFLQL